MAAKKKEPKNKSKAVVLSEREAPVERSMRDYDIVSSVMAKAQLNVLMAKTPEHAIKTRPGGKGKLLRYVPHGYVTDQLNKAFGFDWDYRLMPYFDGGSVYHMEVATMLEYDQRKRDMVEVKRYYVSVYGELTVRIHNPKNPKEVIATVTKPGPGSAVWFPENEFGDALKAAKSDGLKVAAHELGIALDLYYDDQAAIEEYEQKKEAERKREEEAALEEILESNAEEIKSPADGINLLAMAGNLYKLKLQQIEEIIGKPFVEIQATYTSEYWEKIVKSQEKKDG